MDDDNPYTDQATVEVDATAVDHVMVARELKVPAISLMLMAAFGCAMDIYLLVDLITGAIKSPHRIQDPTAGFSVAWLQIGVSVIWLLLHLLVLHGARNMLGMRNYRSARTAALIASIPCISPVIFGGVPIGIWCHVVLTDRGSRQAFDQ